MPAAQSLPKPHLRPGAKHRLQLPVKQAYNLPHPPLGDTAMSDPATTDPATPASPGDAAPAATDPPAAAPAPADPAPAPADAAPDAPPADPPPSTEDRLAALEEMVFETLLPRLVAVIGEIET